MIPQPDDLPRHLFALACVVISTTVNCLLAGRACRWWDGRKA